MKARDIRGARLGIMAALRGIFGTNTELRLLHGGTHEELERATRSVHRMSDEASILVESLNGHQKPKLDPVEQELENIIKDLE